MSSQGIHKPRLSAALAALALIAASLFLTAAPASAHDELTGSDPATDAVLDAAPTRLVLTFSGELLADDGATEVQVTDASGASLTAGDPEVDANVVTQPLSGQGAGAIRVLWKVVSSDGHPISGEYAFTVNAPAPTPDPTPTATATTAQEPTPTATPTQATAPEDPYMNAMDMRPWFVGAIVLLVVVAGSVLYLVVSRRRRDEALSKGAPAGSDSPSDR